MAKESEEDICRSRIYINLLRNCILKGLCLLVFQKNETELCLLRINDSKMKR